MSDFAAARDALYAELGTHRTMVLSTSLNGHVTSRMMSVVLLDGVFYFQTDRSFRKCEQLAGNHTAALCAENVKIEGACRKLGRPLEHPAFCESYKRHFRASFDRYSHLADERLYALKPSYAKKWVYEDGEPFVETWDFAREEYAKTAYHGR